MHSRGGRLVTPVDGYSTVLESSLALSTEVAKMTPADWALTFQMLYELNPASSADGTGGFCCCLAVAWPMPTGLCLCLLGRVTCEVPTIPLGLRVLWRRQCHHQHEVHGLSSDQHLRAIQLSKSLAAMGFQIPLRGISYVALGKSSSWRLAETSLTPVKHCQESRGSSLAGQCWTPGYSHAGNKICSYWTRRELNSSLETH